MVPISLDRARSGGQYWPGWRSHSYGGSRVVVVKGITDRERVQAGRRSRQATPRPHLVKFFLADEELAELSAAAGHAGMARGAFAAEAALAAARGSTVQVGSPLRDALIELMRAAGLARRIGVNLNQAVARLNSIATPAPLVTAMDAFPDPHLRGTRCGPPPDYSPSREQ
jgi:hypothetical protein